MLQAFKKNVLNTLQILSEVTKVDASRPIYRVVSTRLDKNGHPAFDIQIVGKNVILHYSREALLHDPSAAFIYQNMSQQDKLQIKEFGSQKHTETSSPAHKLKIINFKKNYIKSINLDNSIEKITFTICVPLADGEKIFTFSASELIKRPDIFHKLNTNDIIQVSYYAGMQDILDDQEKINSGERLFPMLKNFFSFFIKNK